MWWGRKAVIAVLQVGGGDRSCAVAVTIGDIVRSKQSLTDAARVARIVRTVTLLFCTGL